jgi:hypothetical protein
MKPGVARLHTSMEPNQVRIRWGPPLNRSAKWILGLPRLYPFLINRACANSVTLRAIASFGCLDSKVALFPNDSADASFISIRFGSIAEFQFVRSWQSMSILR